MAKKSDNSIITADRALWAAQVGLSNAPTRFIPGGKIAQDVATVGFGVASGYNEAAVMSDAEYKHLSEMLDADLKREAKHSRSLNGALGKMKAHYRSRPIALAISAVGMLVGGFLGTFIPVPFAGTFVGGAIGLAIGAAAGTAGAFVADFAFDFFFPRKTETPVEVVSQLRGMQQGGQQVTPEAVFVALVGNLREKDKAKIRTDLYQLTGKHSTGAALAAGENEALRKLMVKYDTLIRADTGALMDSNNPNLTASQQYAAVINSGQLDARTLLFRDGRLPIDLSGSEYFATSGYLPPPETPDLGRGGSPARG